MKWGRIRGCAGASLSARSGSWGKVRAGGGFSSIPCRASRLLGLAHAAVGLQQGVSPVPVRTALLPMRCCVKGARLLLLEDLGS